MVCITPVRASFGVVCTRVGTEVLMCESEPPLQGFEIHGSTGAPLPDKNYGWQKKKNIEEYLKKKSSEKEKIGLRMLILFLNMA